MAERDFVAECIRLHVQDKKQLIIRGFFPEDNPEKRTLKVYVNQKEMPISIICTEGPEVRRRYLHYRMNVGQEITASLQLPEEAVTDFKVCSCLGTEETEVFHANRKQFEKLVHHLDSNLEMERFEENQFILTGWSAAGEETACKVIVDGTEVSTEVHWKYRKDVVDVIPELSSDAKCGFEIYVPDKGGSKLILELSADGRESTYVAALDKIRHGENGQVTANIFQKTLRYWKNYGLKNTIKK